MKFNVTTERRGGTWSPMPTGMAPHDDDDDDDDDDD